MRMVRRPIAIRHLSVFIRGQFSYQQIRGYITTDFASIFQAIVVRRFCLLSHIGIDLVGGLDFDSQHSLRFPPLVLSQHDAVTRHQDGHRERPETPLLNP